MTTTPKTKSYYERVLFKIDARRLGENNQQKCIELYNWNQVNQVLEICLVIF